MLPENGRRGNKSTSCLMADPTEVTVQSFPFFPPRPVLVNALFRSIVPSLFYFPVMWPLRYVGKDGKCWCSRIPNHGGSPRTSVKGLLSYHAPPQGISIAGEARLPLLIHGVLLCQVHKVGRKNEAEKANVQGRDELLKNTTQKTLPMTGDINMHYPDSHRNGGEKKFKLLTHSLNYE